MALLAEARSKYESAQSDWSEGQRLATEARTTASDELIAARRKGDNNQRLEALELVVNTSMYLGDYFAANLAATDELAMIRRNGEKSTQVKVLQILAEVQVARGDILGAVENLRSAVDVSRELDQKKELAKSSSALASALLTCGNRKDSLPVAEESVKIYEEIGDQEGAVAARRVVNKAHAERGTLDKAPGRPDALTALQELTTALNERDPARWQAAMDELKLTCAYTQKDIDVVVKEGLEKTRPGTATFLEEQGVMVKSGDSAGCQINEMGKTVHYLNFRVGGLGYGPRFRCANSYKKQVPGDIGTLAALACLQVSEEAEAWEADLQFHPGVLDSMLQSGVALNM